MHIKEEKRWKVWWKLTRPHTLTAAFIPVSIGTALALPTGEFHFLLFLAMLVASLLIQAATNMFNEYFDFKRGLDHAGSVGIGGAIVRHGIAPKTVLRLAFGLFGISMLLGVYICMSTTWWLCAVGLLCMAVAYLYSGGPVPIAYTPFGELFAGLFMGTIIILISFFIQTGSITGKSILISVPVAILVGAINLANNIRDLDGDKENGRKTLAILVGRKNAVRVLAAMFTTAYLLVIGFVALKLATPWLFLVFLSVPTSVRATKGFIGKVIPLEMVPAMKATAQTNTHFGFLLAAGLLLQHWF